MNKPLLTVIVPCYNVEKYLDKCISSIVSQTYTNLEIILIDDGSTDNTGKICDSWQEKDQRIRVIHKQNEGLSCARKTGIENMTAEYVAFVDSDDWIDGNMYSDMMTTMISTNSDIALCDYFMTYEDGRIEHQSNDGGSFEVFGRKEGLFMILRNKWRSYMWNKIFKKHLFDNIEFPKDRLYEDISIMHNLFHHASQSVRLHKAYYFYFQRENSILNTHNLEAEVNRQLHYANAKYDRYLFVKQHPQYHNMLLSLKKSTALSNIYALWNMIDYPQHFPDNAYEEQSERLKQFLSIRDGGIFFIVNLDLLILKIIPRFYKSFYKILLRKSFYKCVFVLFRRKI